MLLRTRGVEGRSERGSLRVRKLTHGAGASLKSRQRYGHGRKGCRDRGAGCSGCSGNVWRNAAAESLHQRQQDPGPRRKSEQLLNVFSVFYKCPSHEKLSQMKAVAMAPNLKMSKPFQNRKDLGPTP